MSNAAIKIIDKLTLEEAAHLVLTGRVETIKYTDADKEWLVDRYIEISSEPKQRYGRTDVKILEDVKHLMLDRGLGRLPGFQLNPYFEKLGFRQDDHLTQVPDAIHTATGTQIECKKLADKSDNLGFRKDAWNHIFNHQDLIDFVVLARVLSLEHEYHYKFTHIFPLSALINPYNNLPMRPYAKAEMIGDTAKWTFLTGEAIRGGVCMALPENQRGPIRE